MRYSYLHPHPAVACDVAVFRVAAGRLEVLLIERRGPPFRGRWALPGGFLSLDETLGECAARELAEETGLRGLALHQVAAFGTPQRDPREYVVSVAYRACLAPGGGPPAAGSDAARLDWHDAGALPALAFDHDEIIAAARRGLEDGLERADVDIALAGEPFALGALQAVHQAVSGQSLDKRNFRRRVLASRRIEPTRRRRRGGPGRPARLYRKAGEHGS